MSSNTDNRNFSNRLHFQENSRSCAQKNDTGKTNAQSQLDFDATRKAVTAFDYRNESVNDRLDSMVLALDGIYGALNAYGSRCVAICSSDTDGLAMLVKMIATELQDIRDRIMTCWPIEKGEGRGVVDPGC